MTQKTELFYKEHVDIHPFVSTLVSCKMSTDDYQAIIELLTLGIIAVKVNNEGVGVCRVTTYEIHKIKDCP